MGAVLRELIDPKDVVVFSSPLGRARQTARLIAQTALIQGETVLEAGLMEVGMGSWDGLTEFEIDSEWPAARKGLDRYNWFFHSPDGENYEVFSRRLSLALKQVSNHPTATRIVVSHGVAGRVLRSLYEGLDHVEALRLDAPQNAVFRLTDGKVERIGAPAH